jgi:hypothetical protein
MGCTPEAIDLFIENKRKGIYISTAKKFSKGSVDVAEKLIENRQLDYFELVDYDKLNSLIKNVEKKKYWSKLVESFCKQDNCSIYDSEEEISKFENE